MKIYYSILFFLIGSVLASFYGVLSTRLPEEKSIITPRSHCDSCNHVLSWYELIPIFSFLFLGGKCKNCKKKLSFYEPISEFLLGLIFMGSYLYYGFSYELWLSLLLSSLCLLIYISDFKYMIILDSPLVISSILIFLLRWYYFDLKSAFLMVGSGIILFLFFLFVGYIGKKIFKRDALGGGDIKLSFVIGMTLGMPYAFIALVLSTFLALPYATFSLIHTEEREVPYGPFLVSALYLVFIFLEKFSYVARLFIF